MKHLLILVGCLLVAVCFAETVIDEYSNGVQINIAIAGEAPPTKGPIAQTVADATDAQGGTRQTFVWKTLGSNTTEYVQTKTMDGFVYLFCSSNLTTSTGGQWAFRYRGVPPNPPFVFDAIWGGNSVVAIELENVNALLSIDMRTTDADLDTATITFLGSRPEVYFPFSSYPATVDFTRITDLYYVIRQTNNMIPLKLYSIKVVPLIPAEQKTSVGLVLCP